MLCLLSVWRTLFWPVFSQCVPDMLPLLVCMCERALHDFQVLLCLPHVQAAKKPEPKGDGKAVEAPKDMGTPKRPQATPLIASVAVLPRDEPATPSGGEARKRRSTVPAPQTHTPPDVGSSPDAATPAGAWLLLERDARV